ncbi:uncharacterized protein LOC131627654 [Vicia villosa]|uniref:uncharacterized protein LOC131627654 n=1 Tax=Vicia villosa TaxID=3911 RepID=UPI00273CBA8E|nr:uncharacterized protein LOC131627654 [Vicia villosa]
MSMGNEQEKPLKSESEQQEKLSKSESEKEESEEDESESESEEDESGSETESDLGWESKPVEYLKEKYEDDPCPCYFSCDRFVYKNKAMIKQEEDSEKAVNEYWESSRNISPYDAIPVPPLANLRFSNFPRPITITEGWRPRFIHLSKLALESYNYDNQGLNYEFEDIVKARHRQRRCSWLNQS